MFKIFDIEKWSQKDHFLFFTNFEELFFGATVGLDYTIPIKIQNLQKTPFFCILFMQHSNL